MEAFTARARFGGRLPWRTIATGVAAGGAIGEIVNAFSIEVPLVAIVFALLFAASFAWIRRGGGAGLILLAVLCASELLFLPAYERNGAEDWIVQGVFAALALVGIVAVTAELRANRAARRPTAR